ncbi:ABC-ATPase domain-containing protein [Nocardiopsis metallicus]
MRDEARLSEELLKMHGASYGRYKTLKGDWDFGDFTLTVERVQADPFAPPSRIRLFRPDAGIPVGAYADPVRRRATADYLGRRARRLLKGSLLKVDTGGQEVIARSSCQVTETGALDLRIGVDLPGHGRRIDGRTAERELCRTVPELIDDLDWDEIDQKEAEAFADSVADTVALRTELADRDLVAFVADGAVLPRRSGVSDEPMRGEGVVAFTSPESLRVSIELPHRGTVTGMGVPEGITLIVGGGFHGKSTLLHALERGVYDHVPGDGRELVVTRADAVKIRAEEGRRAERVDVSPFVRNLPTGADTRDFSTENASGSTSQAANICEAVEVGARTLLVDEDSTATNLMIRDERMQALVHGDREPLVPFVDLVRPLHREHRISTILVMGGSGDYFDVADQVIMMDAYHPHDVTERARSLARDREDAEFSLPRARVVDPRSVDDSVRGRSKLKRRDMDVLTFGESDIDVRSVEQFVDPGQITGAGLALRALVRGRHLDGARTLAEALDSLEEELAKQGVALLGDDFGGDYALPRRHEIAATLNRLRSLRVAGQR